MLRFGSSLNVLGATLSDAHRIESPEECRHSEHHLRQSSRLSHKHFILLFTYSLFCPARHQLLQLFLLRKLVFIVSTYLVCSVKLHRRAASTAEWRSNRSCREVAAMS